MLTEEQKHAQIVQMMEVLELVDAQIALFRNVECIPAEHATQELWESLRQTLPATRELLEFIKASFQQGAKIVDNDAVYAHLQTVIEAP